MNVDGVIRVTIVLQKAQLLLIYCTMKANCLTSFILSALLQTNEYVISTAQFYSCLYNQNGCLPASSIEADP